MCGVYSSSLRRTATVVGQRSNVNDFYYFDTSTMAGTDSGFAAVTGTLDISLDLAKTEVVSYLCAILSSHLGSVGGVLLGTTEAHLTS